MTTLKDVADLAGVSPITVSRVVNAPETVKLQTRQRIEEAMRTLNYAPNTAAKNLASNRTGIVVVYIPRDIDLSNPFMMHLIAGVSEVLSNRMYSMLILRDREKESMCDGYIATGLLKDEINNFVSFASQRNRPVVLFGHTSRPDVICIDIDNVEGAYRGVDHLIKLGHSEIMMINVQEDKDYVLDRQKGYEKALEANGIQFDKNDVVFTENSVDGGAKAVRDIFARSRQYSAIFCATDTIAIGAVSELYRLGYKVPDQLSVVGFDGLGHHLLCSLPITTIQQPVFEVGKMLATALLKKINSEKVDYLELVSPNFILGESTSQNSVDSRSSGFTK